MSQRFRAQVVLRQVDDHGCEAGEDSEVPERLLRCHARSERIAYLRPLVEGIRLTDHGDAVRG